MTTAELLVALAQECPNGVSFDLMAVRLLRHKVLFEDWQIEDLKAEMFQLGDGPWFSREMISDDESQSAFQSQATTWLMDYGYFSVEQLFDGFCGLLRHISTPEYFAAFLRYLGFTVVVGGKRGLLCYQPPHGLDDRLAATSKIIAERLKEADGTLAVNEIEEVMPHLTIEVLESIREQFLPEVHEAEVGGVPCWRSAAAIPLPEDFAEKLTTVVDTLVGLEEKVSAVNLEFALNLFYRIRFRDEYTLPDNGTFMHICAKYYQGGNDVFPITKKPCVEANDSSVQGRRMRGPNTRFRNLGVSIGAKLVFAQDSHIKCTVLDDSNKVEYDGKAWAISALANYLLGLSYLNGFCHFSYEGETLWERRLRLEREGKQDKYPAEAMLSPTEVREAEVQSIGLAVTGYDNHQPGERLEVLVQREMETKFPVPDRRMDGPNTHFRNLGVSIGSILVFTKDSQIKCTVLDDSNKVEYDGKDWTISSLANHLLGESSVSGYFYFTFEGETLWKRLLRLER